jgi:hypothetical protein
MTDDLYYDTGELEATLHKELIMVSNLQALLLEPEMTKALGIIGLITQDFLSERFPSTSELLSSSWVPTTLDLQAALLPQELYDCMRHAYAIRKRPLPSRQQMRCSKIQHGHVLYQPFSISRGNSGVLFEYPGQADRVCAGRIESIFFSPDTPDLQHQICLVIRAFKPLSSQDRSHDPYHSHPIVGESGYALARMYYDELDLVNAYILQPQDIISHIATCPYSDKQQVLTAPSVVVLSLDLVSVNLQSV